MTFTDSLGYQVLRWFRTPASWTSRITVATTPKPGKLGDYWGPSIWEELAGRTVADFGCGTGGDTIEIAKRGARKVFGVEIVAKAREVGVRAAKRENVHDRCLFTPRLTEQVDRIVCIDCFEHFGDPGQILHNMAAHLTTEGCAYVSFGPPWYHPYGGHSFSAFPWAHLLFTEQALLRWRSDHCDDGATRFAEVRGGLNQMTVARFLRLVESSPLRVVDFEAIPIRYARLLHNSTTREFFTSMVKCKLMLRDPSLRPEPTPVAVEEGVAV